MLETGKLQASPTISVVASIQTDPGCVREANEDNGRHIRPNDPLLLESKGILTVVADGMGGHASGEVASEMTVDIVSEQYYSDTARDPLSALQTAVETANAEVYHASLGDAALHGMGTTCVALVLLGNMAIIAHVGDSRVYRLRGDLLEQITEDHSQVMEMVRHGILTREEARHHDDKNVILRALGTQPQVEVEMFGPIPVQIGDAYLLCSDGLSDMIEDYQIGQIMVGAADVHDACEQLIQLAKDHGGHDNVTAGIVKIELAQGLETAQNVRVTRDLEVI